MKDYLFPFHTCERNINHPNLPAQPFSVLVNLISCLILVYASFLFKNMFIKLFFVCVLLFELFHTYSHYKHLPGKFQVTVIHSIAYLANLSFLLIFIHLTGKIPSFPVICLYVLVILVDTISFMKNKFIGYFLSQIILFLITSFYYYPLFKKQIPKTYLISMLILIAILIILFVNEMLNCESMLKFYNFPYHAMIEMVGVFIFVLYILIFKKIDSGNNKKSFPNKYKNE